MCAPSRGDSNPTSPRQAGRISPHASEGVCVCVCVSGVEYGDSDNREVDGPDTDVQPLAFK